MRLESKKYLYDIAQAAALAIEFIAQKSFSNYTSSVMLRSAVERQLEIVGEALVQLLRTDPETASKISEHRRLIAFRTILIHGYAQIDHRVVWNVLELKLPAVRRDGGGPPRCGGREYRMKAGTMVIKGEVKESWKGSCGAFHAIFPLTGVMF